MKILHLFVVFLLVFFSQTAVAVSETPSSAGCDITYTLRVGSKGASVACLQRKLGIIQDGSFGPITKLAVVTFQSGNNLVADGIVGPMTRAILKIVVSDSGIYPAGCTSNIGYSVTTGIKCDSNLNPPVSNPPLVGGVSQVPPIVDNGGEAETSSGNDANNTNSTGNTNTNPNLENMDSFIDAVVEVNKLNGLSESELQIISDALKEAVANNSTDYRKEFEELLLKESKLSSNMKVDARSPVIVLEKITTKVLSFLGIKPTVAIAQAAIGLPFGGMLVLPFYCPYNGSWMLFIALPSVPPKTYVLTYYPGTQGFASYNIPLTRWLLGFYLPPGVCMIPAKRNPISISTEGTITPVVGSSPSPL